MRGISGGSRIISMYPSHSAVVQVDFDLREGEFLIVIVGQRELSPIDEGNVNGDGSFVSLDQSNNVRQTDFTSTILLSARGEGCGLYFDHSMTTSTTDSVTMTEEGEITISSVSQ